MIASKTNSFLLASLISIATYVYIAYFLERTDTIPLLFSVLLLFVAYIHLLRKGSKSNHRAYLGLGILLRLVFLFSIPILSDDLYRFIWDGLLINNGDSPYSILPSQYLLEIPNKEYLLDRMNSPDYFSVYPPFLQYIFATATSIFPSSIPTSIVVMRIMIIFSEVGTFVFLSRIFSALGKRNTGVFVYFLNPLVIIELTANLHFEAVMIFFSTLAIYFLMKVSRTTVWLSALSISLAFLVKLIPLILLPFLLKRLKVKERIFYTLSFLMFSVAVCIPLVGLDTILNIMDSLDLYFQNFEFNASVYYLLGHIAYWWKGYNVIQWLGPSLALLGGLAILYLLFFKSSSSWESLFNSLLFSLTIYYSLATTVHPWYIAFVLFMGCFTAYIYPILWSAVAFLSYTAYSENGVVEAAWVLSIEYITLFLVMIYELRVRPLAFYLSKENLPLSH